jgi:site-specific DNA-methyltransferase (adenine-specific)
VALIAAMLANSTKLGDRVLDLFAGSGSTLAACEGLGRVCYLMEIEPGYCDVVVRRWEALTGEAAVREPATTDEAA